MVLYSGFYLPTYLFACICICVPPFTASATVLPSLLRKFFFSVAPRLGGLAFCVWSLGIENGMGWDGGGKTDLHGALSLFMAARGVGDQKGGVWMGEVVR